MDRSDNNNNQRTICKIGRRLFLAGLVVSASGCQNMIRRGQSPDTGDSISKYSQKEHDGPRYIRDVCGIFGLDYKKVHGIGLAVDLNGTGSAPSESGQRKHLVEMLRKNKKIDNVPELIKSKNTELVIIQGKVPPGIREGETYDLEVVTMNSSQATSLDGGMILQTELRPIARMGRGLQRGKIAGLARGRILVNSLFDSRDDAESNVHGVILGGGKAMEDRQLGLRIQSDEFNQTTTIQIAKAINSRFTYDSNLGRDDVAKPKTDRVVHLKIPNNYKNNIGRYVSVIHHMAFEETQQERKERIIELGRQMSDPSQCGLAALKLEGFGIEGQEILRNALKHQDLEVRFRAAEALAYQSLSDGIDVMRETAEAEPAFRWHAFAALASLDDSAATVAIKSLLHVKSAETRYGAFQSLLVQSPSEPVVNGDWLGSDFYLHRVPSDAEPMIHFSRLKRPEIVIFNDEQVFKDHLIYAERGLTVQANGNQTITVRRYSAEFGDEAQTCSNRVFDVVELLGQIGVGYSQQLAFLREAKKSNALESRLIVNATPKLGRTMARGENELAPEKSERYISSPLPEMFRTHDNSEKAETNVVGSAVAKRKAADDKEKAEAEASSNRLFRLKNWFTSAE